MAILDKINLDFHVLSTGDPKLLAIIDTSVWGAIEDKPAIIEIILPGMVEPRIYNYIKGKTNTFNSSNLLVSPVGEYQDLVDGIYRITVKGSPDSFCKHRDFLKTDQARLELATVYINLGFDNGDKDARAKKELLQDIDLLIRSAEALVSRGHLKKGMDRFKEAVRRINDYNECENCL